MALFVIFVYLVVIFQSDPVGQKNDQVHGFMWFLYVQRAFGGDSCLVESPRKSRKMEKFGG